MTIRSRIDGPAASTPTARIVSVNVGGGAMLTVRGRTVRSGFDKHPVAGPCGVRFTGLDGDYRGDPKRRDDPDHAVCAYPYEHYDYWRGRPGVPPLRDAHFGENLTVLGMPESEVRIGDQWRFGTALLQVSQPRMPCRKLDLRMGIPFVKRFLRSYRVGYYLRVLEEGSLVAGDVPTLVQRTDGAPSVEACVRNTYFEYWDVDSLQRLAASEGLSPAWRETLMDRMAHARRAPGWAGLRPLSIDVEQPAAGQPDTVLLRSPDARPLPGIAGGERVTLVWRRSEDARALRGIFRVCGRLADGTAYRVLAEAEHGDAVLAEVRAAGNAAGPGGAGDAAGAGGTGHCTVEVGSPIAAD